MINVKEKMAGLLIPVFALREEGDLGIGDTQSVSKTLDFCHRYGIGVLQVLPINETGGDNSPYNAISSVALDPVLLETSPDALPWLSRSDFEKSAAPNVVTEINVGAVKYAQVKKLKLQLLRSAFAGFQKAPDAQKQDLDAFKKQESLWLSPYTLFRVLLDKHDGDVCWPRWHSDLQTVAGAEKWAKAQSDSEQIERERNFYAFVQWIAFKQWKDLRQQADRKGVRLMGDIPFGVSRYSADVWANQHLFDLEWSGGAPPETWFQDDLFTMKWGQNWGLPLYRWDEHEKDNFAWWRLRVRKVTEVFHYFRIDHVLGFFRIYSFPWLPERNLEFLELTQEEAAERTGGLLPQFRPRPDEDEESQAANRDEGKALLKVILDAAADNGVVAEDLGLVPPYVRPLLQKLAIPGFTIPYWEKDELGELVEKDELPELSLATYATHDHLPLKLFYEDLVSRWHGQEGHDAWLEVQKLMRFLELDDEHPPKTFTPELHHAFIKTLLETPCWLAIFMITDLLGTSERFNQPGTSSDSNWSLRLAHPLSYFEKTPPFSERLHDFLRLVKQTKRQAQGGKVGTIH